MSDKSFYLSTSPHFRLGSSTQGIMLLVLISLIPEVVYGTYAFGWYSLVMVLTSAVFCVAMEALFQYVTKQKIVVSNLSSAVTGVMLSLVCPPTLPLWMLLLGDLVSIVIAKGIFGGIGSNVFNPALTGRAFLFISFPALMGATWITPGLDATTSATALSMVKTDPSIASELLKNLFIGNAAGCIGETSALLILVSFVFLFVTKVIDGIPTFSYLLGLALCTLIGGGNVFFSLVSGGALFGAVFMITDYATGPVTKKGRFVYGLCAGIITYLIRTFGSYPEGVMFSILIMNCFSNFLNNLTNRMYGYEGFRKGAK